MKYDENINEEYFSYNNIKALLIIFYVSFSFYGYFDSFYDSKTRSTLLEILENNVKQGHAHGGGGGGGGLSEGS